MKIVFLDRDGVINKDPNGYVTRWEEFFFLPNAKKAIRLLTKNGFRIIVISNQGGIAKGLYSETALSEITERMIRKISEYGGKIFSVWYCPHRLEDNCSCKKPKTGLFEKATKNLKFDKDRSFFVGDSEVDIKAGKNFGLKTILVFSGKTPATALKDFEIQPDYKAKDLLEAAKIILRKGVES